MSKVKRKKVSRKRIRSSSGIKDFAFVDCPVAGAIVIETKKGNYLHVFDSIGFMAKYLTKESFEIEGLVFDQEKGWYDADAVIPKYYGKDVYAACNDYAVDRAIRDNLFLQLAIFGKKRPAECVLILSRSEIIKRLESRGCIVV